MTSAILRPALRRVRSALAGARRRSGPRLESPSVPAGGSPPASDRGADSLTAQSWSLSGLSTEDAGWAIEVRMPVTAETVTAAVVLVGRTSQTEAVTPMEVAAATGSGTATVVWSTLATFAPQTLDVWIEVVDADGGQSRRRASVDPSVSADLGPSVDVPGARWYATVNRNVSVEVRPPLSAEGVDAAPRLIEFANHGDVYDLTIAADLADPLGSGTGQQPVLLLIGRRTHFGVEVELIEEARGWTASVTDDHIRAFTGEQIDIYIEQAIADGARTRRRLSAGDWSFRTRRARCATGM